MKHVILPVLTCAAFLTSGCKLVIEFDCQLPKTTAAKPAPVQAEDPTATYDPYEHTQTYGDFTNAIKAGWHIENVVDGPGGRVTYLKRIRKSP